MCNDKILNWIVSKFGKSSSNYWGDHKIKHFACDRDFICAWNPMYKTWAKCFIPRYKTFSMTHHIFNEFMAVKCFISGYEAFYVCFIRGISCTKNSDIQCGRSKSRWIGNNFGISNSESDKNACFRLQIKILVSSNTFHV